MEKKLIPRGLLRGHIWHQGKFHSEIPANLFPPDCAPRQFKDILQKVDGCFSIIIERDGFILAAVDRIRSLPLFFADKDNGLLIGDDAFEIRSRLGYPPLDQSALPEFLLTGYNCLNDTLYRDLKQLEAGQYLVWDKTTATLEVKEYFRYQHLFEPVGDPLEEMDRMHARVIDRLIESAAGRTLVIPLSGGYDSRLIAVMLKRLGYENVICFTYGSRHHGECAASRKVAKFLNYPWLIIEHNRRMWYNAFHSEEMRAYFRFSTHLCSSPHIQDWLAVQRLKERELIPPDAIIVPGHSGGSPQGDNLPQLFEDKEDLTARDLLDTIYRKHYNLWFCPNDRRNELFARRIRDYLQIPVLIKSEIAASMFDEWDWRQRQAKFIVNSIRVYEFFGYEWRLPLWDLEFMEFWMRVPLSQRIHRSLYKQYVKKYQLVPVPVYHDFPWPQRIRNKSLRMQLGNIMDPRYGRFLDYRNRHDYLNTRVASLLAPNVSYPDFVNPDLTLLRADINAIQSLTYINELQSGRLI
ncbi:MAG: asparagine synthase C-terminal domain-containing protein [Candidatus Syntrophosphaera sp.]